MRKIVFLSTLILLTSCEQGFQTEKHLYPDGTTRTVTVKTILDTDSLVIREYKSGQTFLKVNKSTAFDSFNEEVFYYYEDGGLMDYKYYINGGLKFYARYNTEQEIIQMNGDPILWYENPDFPTPIEQNSPRVFKTLTFTPPYMILKSWMNGNETESPMSQIKNTPDSLDMTIIKDDTLGFIFQVPDTSTIDVTVFWSLEDKRTNELLKAGKFSQKYKGIEKTAHDMR